MFKYSKFTFIIDKFRFQVWQLTLYFRVKLGRYSYKEKSIYCSDQILSFTEGWNACQQEDINPQSRIMNS